MTGPIGIVARNAERADRDPVWPVAPEPEAEPEAENGDASPGQTP